MGAVSGRGWWTILHASDRPDHTSSFVSFMADKSLVYSYIVLICTAYIDRVAGQESGDPRDLTNVSWVGLVLNRSCTTYRSNNRQNIYSR